MAQNTALQTLIKELETRQEDSNLSACVAFEVAIRRAYELLPKERQDIEDGYNQGYRDGENNTEINTTKDVAEFDDANNYFIQTFTQNK